MLYPQKGFMANGSGRKTPILPTAAAVVSLFTCVVAQSVIRLRGAANSSGRTTLPMKVPCSQELAS